MRLTVQFLYQRIIVIYVKFLVVTYLKGNGQCITLLFICYKDIAYKEF